MRGWFPPPSLTLALKSILFQFYHVVALALESRLFPLSHVVAVHLYKVRLEYFSKSREVRLAVLDEDMIK